MDTCAKCGAVLGVGRFCLNCGHPVGAPLPAAPSAAAPPAAAPPEAPPAAAPPAAAPPAAVPPARPAARPAVRDEPHDPSDESWLLGDDEEDRPARLHWAAWVLGAVALVAGALYALSYVADVGGTAVDGQGGGAATTGSASGDPSRTGSTDDARPSGPLVDLARDARLEVPATAPPTNDLDGTRVSYEAQRMVDGKRRTAWRMPGDGTGTEITVSLDERASIREVGLVNGYARRVAGVDWYPHNRRILEVTWTFDDGTSVDQVLQEKRGLQTMAVDPVRARSATLTLTRVSIPGSGGLGRDYTAISTLVLRGKPLG